MTGCPRHGYIFHHGTSLQSKRIRSIKKKHSRYVKLDIRNSSEIHKMHSKRLTYIMASNLRRPANLEVVGGSITSTPVLD